MEMHEVTSSNLSEIGYDKDTREMRVHFTKGGRYVYHNVEPEIFEAFLRAESLGKFHAHSIKGFYEYAKVEEETHE